MALHPDFPSSPSAIQSPDIWFSVVEALLESSMDKLTLAGSVIPVPHKSANHPW